MSNPPSAARSRIFGMVVLVAALAALACTPSPDTIVGGTTNEPTEDGAAVTPAEPATASPTTASGPTPTEELPAGDGVFERAAYDPAADWGPPDERDAFDGSNPLFIERTHDNSAGWYGTDGRYHLIFTFRGRWVWYWSDIVASNFYADVVVINDDTCVAGDSGGLIFRGMPQYDAGYMFGVTCDGGYFIGGTMLPGSGGVVCWVGSGNTFGCDPGEAAESVVTSEYMNVGPGAANRIGVMAEGSHFTFFVNGHEVESFPQTSIPPGEGHFALYLGTGQADIAEVMFDDFSLWELR